MRERDARIARSAAGYRLRRAGTVGWIVATLIAVIFTGQRVLAQDGVSVEDYRQLRINEILAANGAVLPQDEGCDHEDLLEIYNGSGKALSLSSSLGWVRLTDHSLSDVEPFDVRYLSFRTSRVKELGAGERLVVFCDGDVSGVDLQDRTQECELARDGIDNEAHAPFRLSSSGERVSLEFVPEGDEESPIVLHEVVYPPLPENVAYARVPERPDNVDRWVFTKSPSFGQCVRSVPDATSSCLGDPNGLEDPIEPDIELIDYSTNHPAAGEALMLRVRITDEKIPDDQDIREVQIHYRVDSGTWTETPMSFLALLANAAFELEKWSIWEGSIPGQEAGALVEYYLSVRDVDGLMDTSPRLPMCETGVGSCNPNDNELELNPGCDLEQDCRRPLSYVVGSSYDGPLVLNEVVPLNETIHEDPTEATLECRPENPTCKHDDFIEIHNSSSEEVDLEGLLLAKGPFRPSRGWKFRSGSKIGPREYLIVWIDNDDEEPGIRQPGEPPDPPNPNDPEAGEYHTDFNLDARSDEIFLFAPVDPDVTDPVRVRYQVVDGARWGTSGRYFSSDLDGRPIVEPLALASSLGIRSRVGRPGPVGLVEEALARVPDGLRSAAWRLVPASQVTPAGENVSAPGVPFRRGDITNDGLLELADATEILVRLFRVADARFPFTCPDAADVDDSGLFDLTDAIFLLFHLFLGGAPPPAPGAETCGPDATADSFPVCDYLGPCVE